MVNRAPIPRPWLPTGIANAFTKYMAAHCLEAILKLPQVFGDEPGFMEKLLARLDYAADLALLREVAPS